MSEHNKQLVSDFYGTALAGSTEAFSRYLSEDFEWDVPSILPWGGKGVGAKAFVTTILPRVAAMFDFDRFGYDSFTANDTSVAAFVFAGINGQDDVTRLAEQWTVRDGRLTSLRVFYFDPHLVIDAEKRQTLGRVHANA
jgi:ketosteroid isomerase-like protein